MSGAVLRRVIIAGGQGGVGMSLRTQFRQLGLVLDASEIEFIIVTRSKKGTYDCSGISFITWDEIERNGLPDCDSVVNLAGSNIIQSAWKKDGPVYTSRINTTRLLVEAMKKNTPKTFVQASACGIYETNTEEILDETSPLLDYSKMNFPQRLVYDWETEANKARTIEGLRTTILRLGFVLGPFQNGVTAMKLPFGIFGLGKIGHGQQPFPWIHERDLASLIFHASLNPDAKGGVLNAVAPQIITQEQFSICFNRALGTMYNLSIPAFCFKVLGRKSVLLLEGPKVLPKQVPKLIPEFEYAYDNIHAAMRNTKLSDK